MAQQIARSTTNDGQDPPPGQLAGRPVARVGYGAMQLGERGALPGPDDQSAIGVLRRARELGIDHVDTAGFYGGGRVNRLIRRALRPYDEDLLLVSKVGAAHREGTGLVPAQRPAELRAAVEADLRDLGVDRLHVVNLRRLDAPPGIVATGEQVVDLDDQLAELCALRDEGKIAGVGLSNVDDAQLRRALPAGIACVQNEYGLLQRAAEPVLRTCVEHDVAFVPFFPLGSAFPGTPKVTEDALVVATAERLGVTPAQVGLAWLLGRAPDVLVIPGTADVGHLEENVAAGAVRLNAATTAELDGRAALAGADGS